MNIALIIGNSFELNFGIKIRYIYGTDSVMGGGLIWQT